MNLQLATEVVYNMDESSLFRKMMLSRGLSSQTRPGLKKYKARVTVNFRVHFTGSGRLPVWIIGKARVPCAL